MERIAANKCQQRKEEGKEHVLLNRAAQTPEDEQIKRDFGEDGEKQKPSAIGANVSCMKKTLNEQEAIQRKRDAPDAAEDAEGRKERQPCMIHAHGNKRREAQRKRGQRNPSFTSFCFI